MGKSALLATGHSVFVEVEDGISIDDAAAQLYERIMEMADYRWLFSMRFIESASFILRDLLSDAPNFQPLHAIRDDAHYREELCRLDFSNERALDERGIEKWLEFA